MALRTSDFAVDLVHCDGEDGPDWSAPTSGEVYGIALVGSGLFQWRSHGRVETADSCVGYLFTPGAEMDFAHPAGGDICTVVYLEEAGWQQLVGDRISGAWPMHVTPSLELAHRQILRSASDVGYAAHELLLDLLMRGLGQVAPIIRSFAGPNTRRDMVGLARAAILEGNPEARTLSALANLLGVSPHHLSRVFHQHTGHTLTRFRNRVRVSRALARLEDGQSNLAALAMELGFADQAHLTRVIKAEFGHTPRQLRKLLAQTHSPA